MSSAVCAVGGKQINNIVVGSQGTLEFSGFTPDVIAEAATEGKLEWNFAPNVDRPDKKSRHESSFEKVDSFVFENLETGVNGKGRGPESVHEFIDGCRGKAFYNGADATIGFKAVATIDAIYRSAKSGVMETVVSLN